MRKNALAAWLLLAPSLLLLGGLVVFPVLYNAWLSLFDKHAFLPVQKFVGLSHYVYFARDEEFWNSVGHGLVYAGTTLVLQLAVGVPAALLLNEGFRGRTLLRGIVLFPYVIPTIVAVMLWKWLLNDSYGLVNHLLMAVGLVTGPVPWLGKDYIMASLVITSLWQFDAFGEVPSLARQRMVPAEV
jgi:multiple sugar transport system permease protein